MTIARVKLGIAGLDKALNGGIPDGNMVIITGGPGTGKSTFCLQFLMYGTQSGERGVYISTEQSEPELIKQANCFGWDLGGLIKKNMIKIIFFDITGGDNFMKRLDVLLKEFMPKRIVVDSMSTLADAMIVGGMAEHEAFSMIQIAETVSPIPRTEQLITKQILYGFLGKLRTYKVTTLLTSEFDDTTFSGQKVSEFVCDGVITLRLIPVGDIVNRICTIIKMRYTAVDGSIKQYDITSSGIELEKSDRQ